MVAEAVAKAAVRGAVKTAATAAAPTAATAQIAATIRTIRRKNKKAAPVNDNYVKGLSPWRRQSFLCIQYKLSSTAEAS
jgi:hypothetical protein